MNDAFVPLNNPAAAKLLFLGVVLIFLFLRVDRALRLSSMGSKLKLFLRTVLISAVIIGTICWLAVHNA